MAETISCDECGEAIFQHEPRRAKGTFVFHTVCPPHTPSHCAECGLTEEQGWPSPHTPNAYAQFRIERDALAAQNAVLHRHAEQWILEAVRHIDAGHPPAVVKDALQCALADPAPRAADLLALVEAARRVVVVADQERFGSENRYNAPGHAHLTPPYWDTGDVCERCRVWQGMIYALARLDGEGE